MSNFTRPNKAKKRKSKNKVNKNNVDLVLFYLKLTKVLKIVLALSIIFAIFYLVRNIKKEKTFNEVKEKLVLTYSKLIYKDICTDIEINGVKMVNIKTIERKVREFCDLENKNDLFILAKSLEIDPWIKNISIKRKLPDTLIINIEEYLPFAIWKTNGNIHLIDEEGKIISISDKEKSKFLHLIVVAGEDSKNNIDSLFNMLSSNPTSFSRIKSAIFVGKRRWNLELDNGIIIKMPEKNIINAWDKLDKILSINGSEIGIKSIDLRNSDKIFLEENK